MQHITEFRILQLRKLGFSTIPVPAYFSLGFAFSHPARIQKSIDESRTEIQSDI